MNLPHRFRCHMYYFLVDSYLSVSFHICFSDYVWNEVKWKVWLADTVHIFRINILTYILKILLHAIFYLNDAPICSPRLSQRQMYNLRPQIEQNSFSLKPNGNIWLHVLEFIVGEGTRPPSQIGGSLRSSFCQVGIHVRLQEPRVAVLFHQLIHSALSSVKTVQGGLGDALHDEFFGVKIKVNLDRNFTKGWLGPIDGSKHLWETVQDFSPSLCHERDSLVSGKLGG